MTVAAKEPSAAYATATPKSIGLIDHITPEKVTNANSAFKNISKNDRVVAVNARASSAMR